MLGAIGTRHTREIEAHSEDALRVAVGVVFILSATAIVNVGAAEPPLTFIVATRFHNARGSPADFLNTCRDLYVTRFRERASGKAPDLPIKIYAQAFSASLPRVNKRQMATDESLLSIVDSSANTKR